MVVDSRWIAFDHDRDGKTRLIVPRKMLTIRQLAAMAWRQLTHSTVRHAFGLASEVVRVTKPKEQPKVKEDKGQAPTPTTPTPECEVSTKSQGEVTMSGGKADLTDTLLLKNCENAAKATFELWKQSNGDQSGDVLVKVTGAIDAKDGATSPTVTVTETGTYYWRERVTDKDDKLIAYGDARKPAETVNVKPEEKPALSNTGIAIGVTLVVMVVLAGVGGTLWMLSRRKHDTGATPARHA